MHPEPFYLEVVNTSYGPQWQIRKREDESIWACVYDKRLAEIFLKTANTMLV